MAQVVHQDCSLIQTRSGAHCVYSPCALWLTGLSGAGKTTLANELQQVLSARFSINVCILDGDKMRAGLCADLGFNDADRKENIRRIAEVAKLFVEQGVLTIVACISPFSEDRLAAKKLFSESDFIEVFVDTPLDVCELRDCKGLYKKARDKVVKNFTGVDSSYQRPENPDIHLLNGELTVAESVHAVLQYLLFYGYLNDMS